MSEAPGPCRVLVFPGGTEIGLEVNRALRCCKDVSLHSAGAKGSSHAAFVFRHHHELPLVSEAGWLAALNALVNRERIDVVFPAHDDVLLALADAAPEVRAGVVSARPETVRLLRSKSATYQALAGVVPVPRMLSADPEGYPVFVKPDRGQGSQGASMAYSEAELAVHRAAIREPLVLEVLPGEEYTVDCFSDRDLGLQFAQGRQRVRTRSGIAMSSVRVHDPAFQEYAARIASRIPLQGAWFYQVKRASNGTLTLLEVGARIGGTMALTRVDGVNLPLLSLYEHLRIPVQVRPNDAAGVWIDRALVNRYAHQIRFDTVYVDLDDTLLLRGQVNTELVRLLYQWLNEGRRLVVLTRHAGDPVATLARFRLQGLFDEVHHVPPDACKSDFMADSNAILIDDSFRERMRVRDVRGIPTFDCSMLEVFLDERA